MKNRIAPSKIVLLFGWIFIGLSSLAWGKDFEIQGKLVFPPGDTRPLSGITVVLLKFTPDAEGKMSTSGPLGRTITDETGSYRFEGVANDAKAAFRLGSRIDGELISSELLFVRPEDTVATLNIELQAISTDSKSLIFSALSMFLEPLEGGLRITEVLTIENPTQGTISTKEEPFLRKLPEGVKNLQLLHSSAQDQGAFSQVMGHFEYKGNFLSGANTLVFQYTLSTWWNSFAWKPILTDSIQQFLILAPPETLQFEAPGLSFTGSHQFGEQTMVTWETDLSKVRDHSIQIKNIPIRQQIYLIAGGLLLSVLLIFVGIWIFRSRKKMRSSSVE